MEFFVARQPIFHLDKRLFAYELLFRDGWENRFPDDVDGDIASAKTLVNNFFTTDIESIVGAKPAFVNFTHRMLVSDCASLFPKDRIVIEILEDVTAETEVIRACRRLKKQGYLLALDDFILGPGVEPLVELADIIKIDFRATSEEQRRQFLQLGNGATKFLAEKVETAEEFEHARVEGFSYLQGYYFCKPQIVSRRDIPPAKFNLLNLINEIHRPDLDIDETEAIMKRDLSLCHKFLRVVNSAAFGMVRRIDSIRQALILLGESNFRKWVSLIALTEMGRDKPPELVVKSLVRASFCQSLGEKTLNSRQEDLFLMGMFSLIDAILDLPMETALAQLPLREDIKASILGEKNDMGAILDLACDYDKALWAEALAGSVSLGLKEAQVTNLYRNSVQWVGSLPMS